MGVKIKAELFSVFYLMCTNTFAYVNNVIGLQIILIIFTILNTICKFIRIVHLKPCTGMSK
jgi:hypothetical protein